MVIEIRKFEYMITNEEYQAIDKMLTEMRGLLRERNTRIILQQITKIKEIMMNFKKMKSD